MWFIQSDSTYTLCGWFSFQVWHESVYFFKMDGLSSKEPSAESESAALSLILTLATKVRPDPGPSRPILSLPDQVLSLPFLSSKLIPRASVALILSRLPVEGCRAGLLSREHI